MNFFIESFDGSVMASDTEGKIIYMNDKAAVTFEKDGGRELIGKNVRDCHNPESYAKIMHMIETHEKNVYTIEKGGKKKLIYQSPWYQDGEFGGLVELSLEIPFVMPHFIRE